MKKDVLSFNEISIRTDFILKLRVLSAFLFVFFIIPFSAQEVKQEVTVTSNATITVVGDAFIYSKDKVFSEQISNNESLKKNSNVEFIRNNELKVTAKSERQQSKVLTSNKKKPENIVLASKKVEKYKSANLPQKDINLRIKNLDDINKFLAGSGASNVSFVFPGNDSHFSKHLIKSSVWFGNVSVKFFDKINYFYNNDNLRLQVFHDNFSIRPPQFLI